MILVKINKKIAITNLYENDYIAIETVFLLLLSYIHVLFFFPRGESSSFFHSKFYFFLIIF